ncbi:hypothetical protein RFI_27673, partial [Reticulomyxa filosa]
MAEHEKVGTNSTIEFTTEDREAEGLTTGKDKKDPGIAEDEKKVEVEETEKGRKKKKEKEEEVPNYGGLRRVGKEFGWTYIWSWCLAVVSSAGNGCTLPLFGTLFREMINSLVYAKHKQKASIRV